MTSSITSRHAGGGREPRLGAESWWAVLLHRRPPWADSVFLRRVAAILLTVFAVTLALRGDPGADATTVVVAARDLSPGTVLASADLRTVSRPAGSIPAGALHDPGPIRGATLSGPVRSGEILTDLRVLGPRLATAAAGPDARIVPIRLADSAVAEILRAGDRVDVIAGDDPGPTSRGDPVTTTARTLATDAAVLLVTPPGGARATGDRIVLVALDAGRAAVVAAGSLRSALTVTLR